MSDVQSARPVPLGMQLVTIRMDRVFDVKLDPFAGNTLRTLFSFESDGVRRFSVVVMGTPHLQSGQTITALLDEPHNWQTLHGLRVHETGEVCAPSVSAPVWLGLLAGFFAVTTYLELAFRQPGLVWPVMTGFALVGLFQVRNALSAWRVRRALGS